MTESFLEQLQIQAQKQAKLNQERFLPHQLDWLTSMVGRYPWQSILLTSLVTAIFFKLFL